MLGLEPWPSTLNHGAISPAPLLGFLIFIYLLVVLRWNPGPCLACARQLVCHWPHPTSRVFSSLLSIVPRLRCFRGEHFGWPVIKASPSPGISSRKTDRFFHPIIVVSGLHGLRRAKQLLSTVPLPRVCPLPAPGNPQPFWLWFFQTVLPILSPH